MTVTISLANGLHSTNFMEEDIQVRVRRDFHYDPLTGILTRITGKRAGTTGTINDHGYVMVKWHQQLYSAADLIWVYEYGDWPKNTIDHEDRNRSNNRLYNLRDVTQGVNNLNKAVSKNPYKGIYPRSNGYRAQITRNGRVVHLGQFSTKDEARLAVERHELKLQTL